MTSLRRWHASTPRYRTVAAPRIIDLLLLYGWAFQQHDEPDRCHAEATQALHQLIALGLPCAPGPSFDPAEVINFAKWLGLQDRDPLFHTRFVRTGRRLVQQGADPPASAHLPPRRLAFTLRRTFNTASLLEGQRLRLRLPFPTNDAALPDLVHRLSHDAAAPLTVTTTPGRVEATGHATGRATTSITLHLTATAAQPDAATPPDRALTLAPQEGPIRITPRVAALADHLGAGRTDGAAIDRFCDFMLDALCCGIVHHDEAGPTPTDWILNTGWYDCYLGAALLVALCRARSIPSRLVGGYLLSPTAPVPHHWAEAWLENRGWTPYDLLAWDLSAGGENPAWRTCFRGHIDHRLRTTCLPRIFTGPSTIPLPAAHHKLLRQTTTGIEASYRSLRDDAVYTDAIDVSTPQGGLQPTT